MLQPTSLLEIPTTVAVNPASITASASIPANTDAVGCASPYIMLSTRPSSISSPLTASGSVAHGRYCFCLQCLPQRLSLIQSHLCQYRPIASAIQLSPESRLSVPTTFNLPAEGMPPLSNTGTSIAVDPDPAAAVSKARRIEVEGEAAGRLRAADDLSLHALTHGLRRTVEAALECGGRAGAALTAGHCGVAAAMDPKADCAGAGSGAGTGERAPLLGQHPAPAPAPAVPQIRRISASLPEAAAAGAQAMSSMPWLPGYGGKRGSYAGRRGSMGDCGPCRQACPLVRQDTRATLCVCVRCCGLQRYGE
jgi:hypothetical protein